MGKGNLRRQKPPQLGRKATPLKEGGRAPEFHVALDLQSRPGRVLMHGVHIASALPPDEDGGSPRRSIRLNADPATGRMIGPNAYTAIVDTGAVDTFISHAVVAQEGIVAQSRQLVSGLTGGVVEMPAYFGLLAFTMPMGIMGKHQWTVLEPECKFVLLPDNRLQKMGADILLGMRCLARGDLFVPGNFAQERGAQAKWTPRP